MPDVSALSEILLDLHKTLLNRFVLSLYVNLSIIYGNILLRLMEDYTINIIAGEEVTEQFL